MTTEWQYNGVALMSDIISWCDNSLPEHSWEYNGWETLIFYNAASWTWFRLRWL